VPALAQREVALAGVALLAVLIALAFAEGRETEAAPAAATEGVPVVGAGADWYRALAAPYRGNGEERTACGQRLNDRTEGVAHPVLPCGAKIVLRFGDATVLTQVIDRGPDAPGREFDVTERLAERLGLSGTQRIEWRFAG
jgi:rare lipoprotein A (peptidoglycan hydrolase)